MSHLKTILSIIVIVLLSNCSSPSEKITSSLKPYLDSKYPKATYEVVVNHDLFILVIRDEESSFTEENFQSNMTETLGEFYQNFLHSQTSIPTKSKLKIQYYSKKFEWESKTYGLQELSNLFHLISE